MNYIWEIYDLKRIKANGLVIEVDYACELNEGGWSGRHIGTIQVSGSTSDEGFIPYENLNKDTVLGWVTSSIDTASIETELSASAASDITMQQSFAEIKGTPWE